MAVALVSLSLLRADRFKLHIFSAFAALAFAGDVSSHRSCVEGDSSSAVRGVSLLQIGVLAPRPQPAFKVDNGLPPEKHVLKVSLDARPYEESEHTDSVGIPPWRASIPSAHANEPADNMKQSPDRSSLALRLELHLPHPLETIDSDARGPIPDFLRTLTSVLSSVLVIKSKRLLILDARANAARDDHVHTPASLMSQVSSQDQTHASYHRTGPTLPVLVNQTAQVGVLTSRAKPFDCSADVTSWRSAWSQVKVEYCCKNEQVACDYFDCDAGFGDWQRGWSAMKIDYCCKKRDRACEGAQRASGSGESHKRDEATHPVNSRGVDLSNEDHAARADAFNFREFGPTTIVDLEVLPGDNTETSSSAIVESLKLQLDNPWSDLRQGPLAHLLNGATFMMPPVRGVRIDDSGASAIHSPRCARGVFLASLSALIAIAASTTL
eukprot:TRINITY_DN8424_c0_g1_i1.p1 TRINITY_DN8424_c0_g1~~TRINITY_DN8424_c0_g1_i1.p1  ORF type:complete len:457 (+),score=72.79 TRINITY_DN8424_c0_g1_i1:57-1373(+)